MADTLPNISLPAGQWVDLYDESGIAVGTQITTQNVGQTRIQVHTGASAPTEPAGFNVLLPDGSTYTNQASSNGEWAISMVADGLINVGES